MAKRVSADKRELMIADYAAVKSYRAVARKFGVSPNTVKAKVAAAGKTQAARAKNGAGAAGFIEQRRERAQDFVDLCLDVLADRDKLEKAPINQITSAMGTMLDKFAGKKSEAGGLAQAIESAWRARENG